MKKYTAILLSLLLLLTACAKSEGDTTVQERTPSENTAGTAEPEKNEMNQMYIKIGECTLCVVLEENESVEALKALLMDAPLTISASGYGGFEKVCALGQTLPSNDIQTITQAGDVCLYNGNQIVIFYGSNSWAYTRLGKVSGKSTQELKTVLGGEESEITLSLTE